FQRLTLDSGEELGKQRTVALPRLANRASAEFFLMFGPGPKVEDTKFISGSEQLRSASKALSQAQYKVAFPESSGARLIRRGLLACYPMTGCNFVLIPAETVRSIE